MTHRRPTGRVGYIRYIPETFNLQKRRLTSIFYRVFSSLDGPRVTGAKCANQKSKEGPAQRVRHRLASLIRSLLGLVQDFRYSFLRVVSAQPRLCHYQRYQICCHLPLYRSVRSTWVNVSGLGGPGCNNLSTKYYVARPTEELTCTTNTFVINNVLLLGVQERLNVQSLDSR